MAEALVKFFIQRLDSLFLQESETFAGLQDQFEGVKSQLKEIGNFLGDATTAEGDTAFHSWANDMKNLVHEMQDHVDEFIIQVHQIHGSDSDKSALKDNFKGGLQKMESRLAETIQKIKELNKSSATEGDKRESEPEISRTPEAEEGNKEVSEACQWKEEDHLEPTKSTEEGDQISAASSSALFRLKYKNLPYYLQSCLMYCCLFPENFWINKGKLIRLLVAEGLVQEKAGEILEDVAEENITELVNLGMLQTNDDNLEDGTKFTVSSSCRAFLKEYFVTSRANSDSTAPRTARRVLTSDTTNIAQSLRNIRPWSLFLIGNQNHPEGNWLNFEGAKFLRVLDMEDSGIKSMPDEVGDLIHLTYLSLKKTDIHELPATFGKLRALQTLDIRWCGYLTSLPIEMLNLERLKHLKMFKNVGVCGMKLPEGISKFKNLLTLTGIHVGGSTVGEIGDMSHLRRLGAMDVTEENVSELFGSIIKMPNLHSLSLEAKHTSNHEYLYLLESFSPPLHIRKLRLEGRLAGIPNWLGSMESLTKLRLGFSHLSESPTLVLQQLPNLKHLTLWQACDAKQLGKEFCKPGGFPKLEFLCIASGDLEEWTNLQEGALPSLKYLTLRNCLKLRMLPEGLQFVTTLKELVLVPLLDELVERLKPDGGEENYKIKHIPSTSFLPISVLNSMIPASHPGYCPSTLHPIYHLILYTRLLICIHKPKLRPLICTHKPRPRLLICISIRFIIIITIPYSRLWPLIRILFSQHPTKLYVSSSRTSVVDGVI